MTSVQAKVKKIIFYDEKSYYSVLSSEIDKDHYKKILVCVGKIYSPRIGQEYSFNGDYKTGKYGSEFEFESYDTVIPQDIDSFRIYLGSGIIKGIREKTASKIVSYFGDATLDVLNGDIERVREVPGLSEAKANALIESWKNLAEFQAALMFLIGKGISLNLSQKIFHKYGSNTVSVIKDNPYRLIDDINGVGFKIADSVAMKIGIEGKNPFRVRAGILHALNLFKDRENVFAYGRELLPFVCGQEVLGFYDGNGEIPEEYWRLIVSSCEDLIVKNKICLIGGENLGFLSARIYLSKVFHAEYELSKRVLQMSGTVYKEFPDLEEVQRGAALRTGHKIVYDLDQREAIKAALRNKVMVLTGGPGTGKTTVLNGIIQAFINKKFKFALLAPTGKAAKRLHESSGMETKTIHRFLKAQGNGTFEYCKDKKIDNLDAVIVDECSMIDTYLMYSLVSALPDNIRIIFSGDVNQLPSIGCGKVFYDFIHSGKIATVTLNTIHRQSEDSYISINASNLLHGEKMIMNKPNGDFYFKNVEKEHCLEVVLKAVSYYKNVCKMSPSQVQVLAPMRKGLVGVDNLNIELQSFYNPDGAVIPESKRNTQKGDIFLRVGDKVMQTKNNYSLGVFNGEDGIIEYYGDAYGDGVYNKEEGVMSEEEYKKTVLKDAKEYLRKKRNYENDHMNEPEEDCAEDEDDEIDERFTVDEDDETDAIFDYLSLNDEMDEDCNEYNMDKAFIIVRFDDKRIVYEALDFDQLTLAYAITVHKSQGSEYPVVILPFTTDAYVMLYRNLLYTAITRAKKQIVIAGQPKALSMAASKSQTKMRNTSVSDFMQKKRFFYLYQFDGLKVIGKSDEKE